MKHRKKGFLPHSEQQLSIKFLYFSGITVISFVLLPISLQLLFAYLNEQCRERYILITLLYGFIVCTLMIFLFSIVIKKLNIENTIRKELEQKHQMLLNKLRNHVHEHQNYQNLLEKMNGDKTQLISTISHELRTPLSGIIGLSSILLNSRENHLSQRQRAYLNTIHSSSLILNIIFNDMIELNKIEKQTIHIHYNKIGLSSFFKHIRHIGEILSAQKKLQFKLIMSKNCPLYIHSDEARLSQILWNILHNAIKFTESGSITLFIYYKDNQLNINITDTGCGIASSELDNIFLMYYQCTNANFITETINTGAGIGLAISLKLAKAMGGNIQVKSQLRQGSTFMLTIPDAKQFREIASEPQFNIKPLRILIVEDTEINILICKTLLEKQGHTIDIAMTGKQALTSLHTTHFDLALIDIQLPDMSGYELAEQYTNLSSSHSTTHLFAFSAHNELPIHEYHQKGFKGVINKPLNIKTFNQQLSHLYSQLNATENNETTELAITALNIKILQEYLDIISADALQKNMRTLEKAMINYVSTLKYLYLIPTLNKELIEHVHKMKGAVGSLGFKRIHAILNKIESHAIDKNYKKTKTYINYLLSTWNQDVNEWKKWLSEYEKQL